MTQKLMLSMQLSMPGVLIHTKQTSACSSIQHQPDALARLVSISSTSGSCSLAIVAAEAAHKSLLK